LKGGISVVLRIIGHAVAASLCLFVPVYLFFWFTQTVTFAKSYSLGVTLVIALVYGFFRICTSIDASKTSFGSYKNRLNHRLIGGAFVALAIVGVLAYTAYGVQKSKQAWDERDARLASQKNQPTSCYDIGVQYGRISAIGLKGENIDEKRDVLIPERCRNQRETNRGIEMGIKSSRS
jgi:hypothetical protein